MQSTPRHQQLVAYIAGTATRHLPGDVVDAAKRALADFLGVAVGAYDDAPVRPVRATVKRWNASGNARIVLGGQTTPALAALANGTMAHAMDYDDTHLQTVIHPAAPVAPALFALAEQHFGPIPGKALPSRKPQDEPPQLGLKRLTVKVPAEQAQVRAWVSSPVTMVMLIMTILFGLWHIGPALEMHSAHQEATGHVLVTVASTVLFTGLSGVGFALLRLFTGSLFPPAALHWAANGTGVVVGFFVNRRLRTQAEHAATGEFQIAAGERGGVLQPQEAIRHGGDAGIVVGRIGEGKHAGTCFDETAGSAAGEFAAEGGIHRSGAILHVHGAFLSGEADAVSEIQHVSGGGMAEDQDIAVAENRRAPGKRGRGVVKSHLSV